MRKIIILLFVIVLTLSALPMTVGATPISELTALASYFPAETPIFVSLRTDDAYFEELDGLYSTLASKLPGVVPPLDVMSMLDLGASQIIPNADFKTAIRSWAGDTAAIGVLSLDNQVDQDRSNDEQGNYVLALTITNRAAAEDFLVNGFNEQDIEFTQETVGNATIFEPEYFNGEGAIILRDDVLLAGTLAEVTMVNEGVASSLASNPEFGATLDLLPEDDYNIAAYFNLGDVLNSAFENMPDSQGMSMGFFTSLSEVAGTQAFGITLMDGRSLVFDYAQKLGDASAIEALGLQIANLGSIDPAFAQHIPANAPLVIHSTNLKALVETSLNNLRQTITQAAEASPDGGDTDLQEMEEGIDTFNREFTKATGLDFETDVVGWMTGDFAAFIRLSPQLADGRLTLAKLSQTLPVDFGIAIEATDGAAAQRTVEGLTQGLLKALEMADAEEAASVEVTQETIGGANVTVITIQPSDSSDMPYPVDILMGANDQVFALGTRNAVNAILAPSNNLADDANFAEAAGYILANASSVLYLNPAPLLPLADLAGGFASGDEADKQVAQIQAAINLFSSGTVSQTMDENGNSIGRMVLTLSE